MGHASSIALGIALGKPEKRVLCFDGDGAVLMHLGALPIIASLGLSNLVHVVFNNGAHESVGGQPTVATRLNLWEIAKACGYPHQYRADDLKTLELCWNDIDRQSGAVFLEICIRPGSRDNLGRPTSTPIQNKHAFVEFARG
jgi:phosphonopyruvate decarboxylase